MKNLCIVVVLFVFGSLISSYSVQSAAVQEQEKVAEKEAELQQQLKDYRTTCHNLQNSYRVKHGSPRFALDSGLSAAAEGCARLYANGAALHSCTSNRGLGESTASASGGPISLEQLCTIGVNTWYAENRQYNYNNPNINNWHNTGHFTYMIWRSTTAVGIGCAQGRTTQCVSLYRPPGNYPTVAAYKANVGPPRKDEQEAETAVNQLLLDQTQLYNVTIS